MRLIDIPPGEIAAGEVWFDGRDLLKLSANEMRHVRGGEIAMIFQEPMTSLNPVFTIGDQISEAVLLHNDVNKKEAANRAIEALREVGVSAPERRVKQYPHELSGGMRQRVALARALGQEARILLMDEPFAALDAITRDVLHDELTRVWQETGLSIVFVTHNVREAVRLGQRVELMSSRPGRFVRRWTVDIEGPRRIESAGVAALASEITDDLRREIRRHAAGAGNGATS
jgi:NitT/TauT family transport system ATP-binding protein